MPDPFEYISRAHLDYVAAFARLLVKVTTRGTASGGATRSTTR